MEKLKLQEIALAYNNRKEFCSQFQVFICCDLSRKRFNLSKNYEYK